MQVFKEFKRHNKVTNRDLGFIGAKYFLSLRTAFDSSKNFSESVHQTNRIKLKFKEELLKMHSLRQNLRTFLIFQVFTFKVAMFLSVLAHEADSFF